jgi:hypothetical protein
MSIPFHLDSSQIPYNYIEAGPITDVTDLITQFRTQVVTGLSWTEPSTALFKTVVDASGRFGDILLTRISATNLEIRVRNQSGSTVCTRRCQIDAGGVYVRYYCNAYGCFVEPIRVANTPETFQMFVLDMTPDAFTDHTQYVSGNGYRTTGDADDAQGKQTGQQYMFENGAAGFKARARRYDTDLVNGFASLPMLSVTGAIPTFDLWFTSNFSGTYRWAGRVCHAVVVADTLAHGSVVRPNIDSSTQAPYKVVGLIVAQAMKVAFRI